MNLGTLDRLIDLEQATITRQPNGEEIKAWAPAVKVWAAVQYDAGNETVDNAQKQAVQRVTFVIRYRSGGLATTFRVRHEGQVYDIEAVAEIGRRVGLRLASYSRA